MFANQIDGGNIFVYNIFVFMNYNATNDAFYSFDYFIILSDMEKTSCGNVGVRSSDAIAGVCGLSNFANTCYMNSGLQVRYESYKLLTKSIFR